MSEVPLCVDLDGTLIKSDSLHESILLLARNQPSSMLLMPLWVLRGRAVLKRELAARALPDARWLPYREELLSHLKRERQDGRRLILATGADELVARAVATHTGLFTDVIASDGRRNLTGRQKLAALSERFGTFDYVGDSRADLTVWKGARRAIVVGDSARLAANAGKTVPVERLVTSRPRRVATLLRAIRVHQWVKNLLVFVPPLAAHRLMVPAVLGRALLAFLAFCLCASAGYLLNDMLDIATDRVDPTKRHRPLASGALSIPTALLLLAGLLTTGVALGVFLSIGTAALLLLYFTTTTCYSLHLKRVAPLDVLVLAGLYTLRVFTGAAANRVPVSPWLLAMSMFMFLSLALVKRASELRRLLARGESAAPSRNYKTGDLEIVNVLGGNSGYLTVLILALYIHSPDVSALYAKPERLWVLCPLLLFWFSRLWMLTNRGQVDADPIAFALKDRCSHVVGLLAVVIAYLAS